MLVAQVNREELAWAAGFFDGEGTTGLAREPRGVPKAYVKLHIHQVSLNNHPPEVLVKFNRYNQRLKTLKVAK